MKRILSLLLALMMLLLVGCGSAQPEPTEPPAPTQSPEEEKVLKILVLGNSGSNDSFWNLYDVFAAEMPEQEVVIGILYYSGCQIAQHVQFAQKGEKVYDYYKNATGTWETFAAVDMQSVLRDQHWDIIVLYPAKTKTEYAKEVRDPLIEFVEKHAKKPYRLMWQHGSPNPNDETFYSPTHDPQPPAGYREKLENQYGFDPVNQMKICYDLMKEKVLNDDRFDKFISHGTAIGYAWFVENVPQVELFRDYTHLTDYGRLIASYALYTQITGETLTQIKVDSVPAENRHRRAKVLGDMEVTEEMKRVILNSITYAQENTWTVPGQDVS